MGRIDVDARAEIERLGDKIYGDLYKPPHKNAVTSADQPIAGQGYNSLPFVFDLVSLCNDIAIPATPTAKAGDAPAPDDDGQQTIRMLTAVNERISEVSTNAPKSLAYILWSTTMQDQAIFCPMLSLRHYNSLDASKEFERRRRLLVLGGSSKIFSSPIRFSCL